MVAEFGSKFACATARRWGFALAMWGLGAPLIAQQATDSARTAAPVEAAQPSPQEHSGSQQTSNWFAPKYDPDGFDWIRHKNGEWLKGELIAVYDRKLQFDSKELNEREFDLEDIAWIRSSRRMSVVLTGDRVVRGTLLMRDGTVLVDTGSGERRLVRQELISIVPVAERWYQLWKGRFSLGLNASYGNTNLKQLKVQAELMRRSDYSRLRAQYIGNIGEANGAQNANSHRVTTRWDLFMTRRWFIRPISIDFWADRFQNIDYQFVPAAGTGYYAIDEKSAELIFSVGAGWRYTRYLSVQPDEQIDSSLVAVLVGVELEWDITSDLTWSLDYSVQIAVPDTSATNMHLLTSLSIDLFKDFDLDLSFQWDRIGQPRETETGETPLNDDFSTSIGIAYKF